MNNTTQKKTRKLRHLNFILLFSFVASQQLGDISIYGNSWIGKSDYLYNSRLLPDAYYTSSEISLYNPFTPNSRIYISANKSTFFNLDQYNSYDVETGLQYRYLGQDNNQFFWGIYYRGIFYEEDILQYDSNKITAYIEWKKYYSAQQSIYIQYQGKLVNYIDIPEASDRDQQLSLSYHKSFYTKTSLFIQTKFGAQYFNPIQLYQGMKPLLHDPNSLMQGSIRLSQSISTFIGMSAEFGAKDVYSTKMTDPVMAMEINSPILDTYTWKGTWGKSRISWFLPKYSNLVATYGYYDRYYPDVSVYQYDMLAHDFLYDENGSPILIHSSRRDSGKYIQLSISKDWYLPIHSIIEKLSSNLEINWQKNSSNNSLYDVEGLYYSFGLSIEY